MKIVLVTNDFPPRVGGIQTYLWNIYRRLAERGVDVTVITRDDPDAVAFDAGAGMEIIRRPLVALPSHALRRLVATHAADADVVSIGATLPMARSVVGAGPPLVVHTHGFEVGWAKLPGARALLRGIFRETALVTHITTWTGRALADVIGDRPTMQVRTGVDLEAFMPPQGPSRLRERLGLGDRPTIGSVSRLVRRKGADTLIAAMPEILASIPDAALVLVGDGPDAGRIRTLAARSPARDAIHVVGSVPYAELADAYAAGDVFAMPCRTRWGGFEVEGLGLVYLEAQATGRPAITGDSGGAPEAIDPGRTGLTVRGGDARGLADALIPLLADPARRAEMGVAARRFVTDTYDWNTIAASFHERLETLS